MHNNTFQKWSGSAKPNDPVKQVYDDTGDKTSETGLQGENSVLEMTVSC